MGFLHYSCHFQKIEECFFEPGCVTTIILYLRRTLLLTPHYSAYLHQLYYSVQPFKVYCYSQILCGVFILFIFYQLKL